MKIMPEEIDEKAFHKAFEKTSIKNRGEQIFIKKSLMELIQAYHDALPDRNIIIHVFNDFTKLWDRLREEDIQRDIDGGNIQVIELVTNPTIHFGGLSILDLDEDPCPAPEDANDEWTTEDDIAANSKYVDDPGTGVPMMKVT